MELINTLGIDWRILLWQVVMFLVLLGMLRAFAYGPILKALEERQARIAKGLADAAAAEAFRAEADALKQKALVAAAQESQRIVADSKKAAEQLRAEAVAKTRVEVERMLKEGMARIEQERAAMMAGVETELEGLLAAAVGKVLDRAVDAKDHGRLMQDALAAAKEVRV